MDNMNSGNDASKALEAAGFDLSKLSDEQRQVLTSLTPEEIHTLTSVKERLEAAADVQAYRAGDNGGLFY